MSQFSDADGVQLLGAKRKAADELAEGGEDKAAAHEAPRLPDSLKEGWIACPRLGQLVGRGPFIPCKPILAGPANALIDEGDRFDSNMFMERQVSARRDVGMVISLLDPKRGWPTPEKQEWEDWDVDFVVIKPESAQQVAADVQRAVRAHLAKQPKRMVAIYCEDGCNLSGYAIVSYMHTAVAMPLQDALKAFADARPPGIFHPEYLDDLWKRLGGASAPPPPSKPEWASDGAHLVHAKGAFSMPMPQLPQLPQIQPVPASGGGASKGGEGAEEKLPAGWSQHFSKTHSKPYYFHRATGKQLWAPPPPDAGGEGEGAGKEKEKAPVEMCGALHILVKHQKSRRTSSWKDKEGKVICNRTPGQATAAVQTLRDKLAGLEGKALRAEFANVARRESDCSSAVKGGDLETFRRGAMQPPFDKAAFALKVGEMSEVIETDSGSHIILRTS